MWVPSCWCGCWQHGSDGTYVECCRVGHIMAHGILAFGTRKVLIGGTDNNHQLIFILKLQQFLRINWIHLDTTVYIKFRAKLHYTVWPMPNHRWWISYIHRYWHIKEAHTQKQCTNHVSHQEKKLTRDFYCTSLVCIFSYAPFLIELDSWCIICYSELLLRAISLSLKNLLPTAKSLHRN